MSRKKHSFFLLLQNDETTYFFYQMEHFYMDGKKGSKRSICGSPYNLRQYRDVFLFPIIKHARLQIFITIKYFASIFVTTFLQNRTTESKSFIKTTQKRIFI